MTLLLLKGTSKNYGRRRALLIILAILTALCGCKSKVFSSRDTPSSTDSTTSSRTQPAGNNQQPFSPNALRVLAFGDSGSCDKPENPALCKQNEVARAMLSVCQTLGCDIGIMLGDNIYEQGVKSADDDMFRYKYEYHYAPLEMQMYAALGNHDLWGTDVSEAQQIEAQVAYSARSGTWNMQGEYYDFVQGNVHFFVVSTNTFTEQQTQWLEEALLSSTATWKVVYGHHPIYSNGRHGDNYLLIDLLLPAVCRYADLYVAGHDHDLQLLSPECPVPFVVSGAAGKTRPTDTNPDLENRVWSKGGTYGFTRFVFEEQYFDIEFYDGEGNELFRTRQEKRQAIDHY